MTQADRLTKLTSQLIGDIGRLPGVQLDSAGEQQLAQLLTDAFEAVGHVAIEGWEGWQCQADDPVIHHTISHGQEIPPAP